MDDVALMAVVERLKDLFEALGGLLLREEFLLDDPVEQFTSFANLSDQVDILLLLKVLVELEDVGVVQMLQDIDLSHEAVPVFNLVSRDLLGGSD